MHFSLINWITASPPSHSNLLGRLPVPFIPLLSPPYPFPSSLSFLSSCLPHSHLEVFQILLFTCPSPPFVLFLFAHMISSFSLVYELSFASAHVAPPPPPPTRSCTFSPRTAYSLAVRHYLYTLTYYHLVYCIILERLNAASQVSARRT